MVWEVYCLIGKGDLEADGGIKERNEGRDLRRRKEFCRK